MKYRVIVETSSKSLEDRVNSFIEIGWIPQGGVSVSSNGYYSQAMIITN